MEDNPQKISFTSLTEVCRYHTINHPHEHTHTHMHYRMTVPPGSTLQINQNLACKRNNSALPFGPHMQHQSIPYNYQKPMEPKYKISTTDKDNPFFFSNYETATYYHFELSSVRLYLRCMATKMKFFFSRKTN